MKKLKKEKDLQSNLQYASTIVSWGGLAICYMLSNLLTFEDRMDHHTTNNYDNRGKLLLCNMSNI